MIKLVHINDCSNCPHIKSLEIEGIARYYICGWRFVDEGGYVVNDKMVLDLVYKGEGNIPKRCPLPTTKYLGGNR